MTTALAYMATRRNAVPFRAGVIGVAGDTVLLYVLLLQGVPAGTAGMISLFVAAIGMWLLPVQADTTHTSKTASIHAGWFALTVVLTVFVRAGVLAWMTRIPGCPVIVTAAVAAMAAGLLLRAASAMGPEVQADGESTTLSWQRPVTALLIYAALLHLVYLGLPELIHEEAYYWNYSRHLAFGYLDHPPMVGWIVRGFTALLGHTELGVRAGSFFSWLLGGWFVFKLTRHIFDAATAVRAVLLFAVLPAYFLFGFFMTPEAPLYACWAGALYFLYRALIDEEPTAWLGAGIFLGAGMLSKYTMVLLAFAVIVFMLVDSRSRGWFRRVPPYWAAAVALLLFSPVVFWNFQHDWISFVFQGPQRAAGAFEFNLPALLGYVAALLTPIGLAAVAVVIFSRRHLAPGGSQERSAQFARGFRLLVLTTLLPFSVFVFFSLFRLTKLNWTGPVWLGLLPFMARMMTTRWRPDAGRWRAWLSPRTWQSTAVILLLIYSAGLQYFTLGLWGLPYPKNDTGMVALGWEELAAKIESAAERVEQQTGRRPLVVGMESDRLSSWLAFYRSQAMSSGDDGNTGAAALDTAGPHLFGQESHMYRLWFPLAEQDADRPLLLVGENPNQLAVNSKRQWAGPVNEVTAEKNGQQTWRLYYRVLQ